MASPTAAESGAGERVRGKAANDEPGQACFFFFLLGLFFVWEPARPAGSTSGSF